MLFPGVALIENNNNVEVELLARVSSRLVS
jgi:hypothetical protein